MELASNKKRIASFVIDDIIISVEVLYPPEQIDDINELDVRRYGLIISDNIFRRGVLLPNITGIDTVEEQIKIVKRKAGIAAEEYKGLEFSRFRTEKFH